MNRKTKDILRKVLLFLIGTIVGIIITDSYHNITAKADVFAYFKPLTTDNLGNYFPIEIINTGDKPLKNVDIKIKTCYMDEYKTLQTVPLIDTDNIGTHRFWNEKTISMVSKKLCLKEYNFSFHNCEIYSYIVNSTTLYVPETNCSIFFCDFCPYTIKVRSDEIEDEKEFTDWFISPKEVRFTIKPGTYLSEINVSNLERFSSPLGFNIFTPLELCLYNESCPFTSISSTIRDKENYLYKYLLHNLYPFDIEAVVPPNKEVYNYSNINFSIMYTEEQEKEIIEKGFDVDDFELVWYIESQ